MKNLQALGLVCGPVAILIAGWALIRGTSISTEVGQEWKISEAGSTKVIVLKSDLGRLEGSTYVAFQNEFEQPPLVFLAANPDWGHTVTHSRVTTKGFDLSSHVHLSVDQKLPGVPHKVLVDYIVVTRR